MISVQTYDPKALGPDLHLDPTMNQIFMAQLRIPTRRRGLLVPQTGTGGAMVFQPPSTGKEQGRTSHLPFAGSKTSALWQQLRSFWMLGISSTGELPMCPLRAGNLS